MRFLATALIVVFCQMIVPPQSRADDERSVALADGKVTLTAPQSWEKKTPQTRIVDFEFSAPAAEGDDTPARVTVMGAGGSIEANIDRWIGQFTQPDGRPSKERTKVEKFDVRGETVHLVDITGRYKDQRGPFAPAEYHDDYRMIAAIIATDKLGQYFVKMYGPKATVAKHEKPFKEMLGSLKVQKADADK